MRHVPLRELRRRRAAGEPGAPRGFVQERDDGIRQAVEIVGADDEPIDVVAEDIVDARKIGRDHRRAARKILHQHARQPLPHRGNRQNPRARSAARDAVKARQNDIALDPERPDARFDRRL